MAPLLPSVARGSASPSPNHARLVLLEAFLSYVATFYHGQPCLSPSPHYYAANGSLARSLYAGHVHPRNSRAFATAIPRRGFHNYFVTHLPSSSLHPDSRHPPGLHHKLPRAASTPHTPSPSGSSPAPASPPNMPSRDLTVVRIPLRSAKHHFGACAARGTRVYNEDTNQAGTIDMPAFAKRAPISLVRSAMANSRSTGEGINADSASGDPQVFYFGVFDGHGGTECSEFLRDELHSYIEEAAREFHLGSSLRMKSKPARPASADGGQGPVADGAAPVPAKADGPTAKQLERELVAEYKNTVGGYFRRFKPANFDLSEDEAACDGSSCPPPVTAEAVLTYAFLRADLDFITAQARKPDPDDPYVADFPLNRDEVLGSPHLHLPPPSSSSSPGRHGHGGLIGGPARFKGGSTASVALISTPTPAPFWHPAAHSSLLVAHVGDTRVLLCETATGLARPLTSDHHPSSPAEARRLTRYAAGTSMTGTDSFGEERIAGLANSRAFGDMQSKRVGVSAEPEVTRAELGPAQYSFLVLVSDGVSGTLSDQEIVDVVKESRTPEQGARDVVEYATEISSDGDNATCLVVRLGGWERRSEGGLGSLGTKEIRDARRVEADDPRRGRRF